MPHSLDLVLTLTGGLAAALVLGFASQRLRLSPIVGYLVAGIVVGPFTPGFVAQGSIAQQFAELGVILLLFGVGLHLHVGDLLAVRRIAVPGALAAMTVATALHTSTGHIAVGWLLVEDLFERDQRAVAPLTVNLRTVGFHGDFTSSPLASTSSRVRVYSPSEGAHTMYGIHDVT